MFKGAYRHFYTLKISVWARKTVKYHLLSCGGALALFQPKNITYGTTGTTQTVLLNVGGVGTG